MVIFLNIDGTAEKVVPKHVYQGSNNVTEITVVAPFASNTTMQIGFILPNGLYWNSSDGERYVQMSLAKQNTVEGVSAWSFTLPFSVTEREGEVFVAINAITTTGNTTSYLCKITVEESVLPPLPDEQPEFGAYDLLQQHIAKLEERTIKVPYLVADINKVAPNAIQYVRDDGSMGAVIVIEGGETAPIPVNAAGVVTIPKTAWQPVYNEQTITGYTTTISASLHGQMRDGATAADLWVSFDETEDGVITGAYQGYTVSESGDITINVNQPVAMTVRVWNGKGLVDEVARDMVEQETARAETAESDLQSQIDEIVDSGVDLTARQQIAEEIARAEAEEARLQADITAETNRASAAEGVLASDIRGLREDISNESHFRGMFDNVEVLLAAYPTATPNDYAYIVGGNQWIYQNDKWTDSNVPSPNTAVPASDETPLMDSEDATPGASSAFARGDHRHPSDTNKADTFGSYPDMHVGEADYAVKAASIGGADIDGLFFDGASGLTRFATCGSSATTPNKTATLYYTEPPGIQNSGFKLYAGTRVVIKFTNANTVNSPTLNINGTGAKLIKADNDVIYVKWLADAVMEFVYDGTYWVCISGYQLQGMRIGKIYESDNSTSPEILYGGKWEPIEQGRYLKAITSGNSGPGDAGLPNIEGTISTSGLGRGSGTVTGALSITSKSGNGAYLADGAAHAQINFDASQGGTDPIYGKSDTVTPLNYGAYMWRRTA